jgi:predicted ribosomally synthesized peptide with nif11-like leader
MSKAAADAFLERAETDETFRTEFESLGSDQSAVLEHVREAGYDVDSDDVLEAFTERYGVELSPEQLDAIAAGDDAGLIAGAVVGGVLGAGVAVGVCAAFAA